MAEMVGAIKKFGHWKLNILISPKMKYKAIENKTKDITDITNMIIIGKNQNLKISNHLIRESNFQQS